MQIENLIFTNCHIGMSDTIQMTIIVRALIEELFFSVVQYIAVCRLVGRGQAASCKV